MVSIKQQWRYYRVECASLLEDIQQAMIHSVTSDPSESRRYFKTTPGSYGEHDEFIGVKVPDLRRLARVFATSDLALLKQLLQSHINEYRLLALLILTKKYSESDYEQKQCIYQFYLDNIARVNNWNLVDASAHLIIGAHLWDGDRSVLKTLAKSEVLWERRIAIVSTLYFIRKKDIQSTFMIAELLIKDTEDLIHKAVGWMLREAGKQDIQVLLDWLRKHARSMPKTMLRSAMERFDAEQKAYITSITTTR